MPEDQYNVTAEQVRAYVERYESLEAEKKDIAEQQKDLMAEAKGSGFDCRALKEIIKLRAQDPNDRAEREAILDTYKAALGIE